MSLTLNTKYLDGFLSEQDVLGYQEKIQSAHDQLHDGTGPGSDFLGWVDLPDNLTRFEFAAINGTANMVRESSDVFVVIGIGGSYLGARAAIDYLGSPLRNHLVEEGEPEIYFIGNSISPTQLAETIEIIGDRDFSVNVISKSGSTTESALAFRVFRQMLEEKYGKEDAARRIFCTTDPESGALKKLADEEGYRTFEIPSDVGGRYSVLSPVGLLPIAVAGFDIETLISGAVAARKAYLETDLEKNPCYQYAAIRHLLYEEGKTIEVLAAYEPSFQVMGEWYKQLFGESEGKDGKGLFPASMIYTTDLHSLGQYVQDGPRHLFETVVHIGAVKEDFRVDEDPEDFDGLNYLADRDLSEINHKAMQATLLAHSQGGVPNLVLEVPARNEESLGWLFYFFQKACAISGYLLGVDPFDQPGVEEYKQNMFALLGKPGLEEEQEKLEALLDS